MKIRTIKINGIEVNVILPSTFKDKDLPKEINSKQKCIKHKTCKIYDKNGVTCNDEKEAQGFCGLRRKK